MEQVSALELWAFILFLAFVVWPMLYILVDQKHISRWWDERTMVRPSRWARDDERAALRMTPPKRPHDSDRPFTSTQPFP